MPPSWRGHLADKIQRLLGAVGDQNIVGIHLHAVLGAVAGGDILAQRPETLGGGILQRAVALVLQHPGGGHFQLFVREKCRIGQAAGKGDHFRIDGDFEYFSNKGRLYLGKALGKKRLHRGLSELQRVAGANKTFLLYQKTAQ